jgi:hypothetical protein
MTKSEIDFRANPPGGYWRWFREWVAWLRYQAALDDRESCRRKNYDPDVVAWWME